MTDTAIRPIHRATHPRPGFTAAIERPPPRRILIAQDCELADQQQLSATELADAGFHLVGPSTDVAHTTKLVTDLRPDATIVDITNGLQTAAALRDQRLGPVVMLADQPSPELITAATSAGVMALVVAPLTRQRLFPAIELAIARHGDAATLRAQIADISDRLDTRKVIERAKSLLMTHQHLTEQEAFRFLQRTAMNHRKSMRDIAHIVLDRLPAA